MRKKIFWYSAETLIFFLSFYLLVLLKFGGVHDPKRIFVTGIYIFVVWMVITLFTRKVNIIDKTSLREIFGSIAFSNIFILAAILILIRIRPRFAEIRFLLIYLVFLGTMLEFVAGILLSAYNKAKNRPFTREEEEEISEKKGAGVTEEEQAVPSVPPAPAAEPGRELSGFIVEETDESVLEFIRKHLPADLSRTLILSTTTRFNIVNQPLGKYDRIINLKRINDIQFINKFFEAVNEKLVPGGIFIDWVETYSLRKQRILAKYPPGLNYLVYTADFIVKRVFPKLTTTKKIYFLITRGNNRVLSKAESFGRLYSCGFRILEECLIGGRLFFVVDKIKEPAFDYHPTYGPLIRLKRIGKNGKIISVYKLRTMHAYSEYLQGYIYDRNELEEGGKFKDDFRVTTLGRIFRKLWLDELPMLVNLLRGDLKLVGVRPLSRHYFDLYSEELKARRIRFRPGLIPPFYADLPKTLTEIMESEMKYLEQYEKHPIRTDFSCFFRALYNIVFRHARSK